MAGRVLIDDTGLRIARAGVDVEAAGLADLHFRADDGSAPVILKSTVALNATLNVVTTIWYGQTLPQVPMSVLFWSPGTPGAATTQFMLSAMGNMDTFVWPVGYAPSSGDTSFFFIRKFVDRIEMHSERNFSSGAEAPGLGGCVSAVIYDMR